ncbi:MAG: hypothetical protein WC378_09070 [Opitutaceae bacterium]|jgi:hypothetical protein
MNHLPPNRKARQLACIVPNSRGGWGILLPERDEPIGNYADQYHASRVAVLNGYAVTICDCADQAPAQEAACRR